MLAHTFLKKTPTARTRFLVGCRLDLTNDEGLLCYPTDRAAYGRLTRLLTLGKRRAGKGQCELNLNDVVEHAEGQRFIVPFPTALTEAAMEHILACAALFPKRLHLALTHCCRGDDKRWIQTVADFARSAGVPTVATNDALYHAHERKPLQDVLTCIRETCTLEAAGFRLQANGERDFKSPRQMHELFAAWPEALAATLEIADACRFSLDELRYEYPEEIVEPGTVGLRRFTTPYVGWCGLAFSKWHSRGRQQTNPTRTETGRRARVRAVFPHRPRDREVCHREGDSAPGAGLGSEFGDLLLPEYHAGRPGGARAAVRAFHFGPRATSRRISTSISNTTAAKK